MKIDTTTEVLTRTGGIAVAGKVFKEIGLDFTSDAILLRADKQILKTMTGLFLQGRNSFEEVNMVRNCSFFSKALDLCLCSGNPAALYGADNRKCQRAYIKSSGCY